MNTPAMNPVLRMGFSDHQSYSRGKFLGFIVHVCVFVRGKKCLTDGRGAVPLPHGLSLL